MIKPRLSGNVTLNRTDASLVALRRILRASEIYGRELARAAGLTAVQLRVLQVVAETDRCTATLIARRLRVSQATVTSLIDRLVEHGMVERHRSDQDRRHILISLTGCAHKTLERAPETLQTRYMRRFEALKPWEQAQLIAVLGRVVDMLDADGGEAMPVLGEGDI